MKSFYEMLQILESENVKTPGGYKLTPEELEEYENERSPMYKALMLKDIDAKRKAKEKRSPEKIAAKEAEKRRQENEREELEKEQPTSQEDSDKLYPYDYCFKIVNAIRALQQSERKNYGPQQIGAIISSEISGMRYRYPGQFESQNQQIIEILEKINDRDFIFKKIKPIMEKLGMKIVQKVGDRSKFNPDIHKACISSVQPEEDVILLSDLIMFENNVMFEAQVVPINEYTLKNYRDIIENPEKNKQEVHF